MVRWAILVIVAVAVVGALALVCWRLWIAAPDAPADVGILVLLAKLLSKSPVAKGIAVLVGALTTAIATIVANVRESYLRLRRERLSLAVAAKNERDVIATGNTEEIKAELSEVLRVTHLARSKEGAK
jgi:hypothetical protein